jgi:phospholipid/cholesterol/gamma-HCH transport system substrate-binding protein
VPRSTAAGRIAAILALVGAAIVVILLLTGGGGGAYAVTAKFENASQLVPGNNVTVAGVAAGSVKEIELGDDGQALVKLEVQEKFAPLPEGTHATIRSQSLSGIANRYVALDLPEGESEGTTISNGGTIEQSNTTSEVDLDELFNTLDEPTVRDLKSVIKGFARSYDGVGPQANRGFRYLNPLLSTSRRVFGELNSDQPALERLIVDSAALTSNLAERSDDLEQLIGNANRMFGAIGRRERELASAVAQLPDFMRQANTTFFNLRVALDDVDPLVDASKPVAKKLQPFMRNLRGFARGAVPTVRDLAAIVKRKGRANDLIELTRLQVPLARIAVGPVRRNGQSRQGAFPESVQALTEGLPQLRFFRPYIATEAISGWFDDFGHSGFPDAIGGVGRISTTFNAFTPMTNPFGAQVPNLLDPLTPGELSAALDTGNLQRCPGSNERGVPEERLTYGGEIDCNPDDGFPNRP